MLTAIVVELDGVLVDTRTARADAVAAAFATIRLARPLAPGAPDTTYDVADDLSSSIEQLVEATLAACARAGDPAAATVDDTARALTTLQAERAYRARLAAGVTLVEGAHDAIQALSAVYRLAVVTAWTRGDAERVLEHAGLGATFRFIVAADDGPGFASASKRYARAVVRVRGATARPDAQPIWDTSSRTVALAAGATGFAAAHAAGARPVLVDPASPLRDLTPARLTVALDAASLGASTQPQSTSRR